MPEENGGGWVYHIDLELLKRARERGLQINIEKIREQIQNAEQDLALIKTAENALGEIQAVLQRMREIAVEAASNPKADRKKLNRRLDAYKRDIDKIVESATCDGVNLLDGSMGSINKIIAAINATMNGDIKAPRS